MPALLSGGKVIISTGTKTLQDQLFQRDLPLVRDALKVPVTVALLKGRGNYVCHHHLERTSAGGTLATRADVRYLKRIETFARTSTTGDKGELADVPETAAIWSDVTSTRENCLGSECTHYDECFVMNARKQALAADVVVVNHHLFFADVMLRDEGLTELLPACNTVILDEAHQLPDTATLFFGEEVTAGQLGELARDAEVEVAACRPRLHAAARRGAGARGGAAKISARVRRCARQMARGDRDASSGIRRGARRAGGGNRCVVDRVGAAKPSAATNSRSARRAPSELATRVARWRDRDDPSWIRWVEVSATGWQLRASPLSIAEMFSKQVTGTARAWIFTSATLAIGGDFSLYQRELGLGDAATGYWESPFDYANQAMLYLPRGSAAAEQLRAYRRSRRRRPPGAAGKPRPRVPAVHDVASAGTRARNVARGNRARHPGVSVAGAGRRFAHRIAVPIPPAGQRDPSWQSELLGRCRCAGRGAVSGRDRQASLRAA